MNNVSRKNFIFIMIYFIFMKKSLIIVGCVLILSACIMYFLDPYTPPYESLRPLQRFNLGEPSHAAVKSTKIEVSLGPYGGTYSFWLECEMFGDCVNVDVYVDGQLVDNFVEASRIDTKSYIGRRNVTIYITAVKYSELRYEPFYLEFVYGSHLVRYGGYLYPQIYALAPLLFGIASLIFGLKLSK
jgi:hypothetical protein